MSEEIWVAVGSVAGVVTAVATTAMAVAIVVTALYAKGTLRAAKDDSRARSRPVLVAYLESELLAHGTILLLIKNFGPSPATDVRVTFDPPAPPTVSIAAMPNDEMLKWVYQRFAEAIPVWAPAWSTSNVVRVGPDELSPFEVTISYTGPDGTKYVEQFRQHPDHILKGTLSTPSQTNDPVKLGQQGVAALQALVRTIRTR